MTDHLDLSEGAKMIIVNNPDDCEACTAMRKGDEATRANAESVAVRILNPGAEIKLCRWHAHGLMHTVQQIPSLRGVLAVPIGEEETEGEPAVVQGFRVVDDEDGRCVACATTGTNHAKMGAMYADMRSRALAAGGAGARPPRMFGCVGHIQQLVNGLSRMGALRGSPETRMAQEERPRESSN